MTLAEQVGVELERIRNGRSRRELAEMLGCAPQVLLRLERGDANPTLARLERVAAVYGIELVVKAKPRPVDL